MRRIMSVVLFSFVLFFSLPSESVSQSLDCYEGGGGYSDCRPGWGTSYRFNVDVPNRDDLIVLSVKMRSLADPPRHETCYGNWYSGGAGSSSGLGSARSSWPTNPGSGTWPCRVFFDYNTMRILWTSPRLECNSQGGISSRDQYIRDRLTRGGRLRFNMWLAYEGATGCGNLDQDNCRGPHVWVSYELDWTDAPDCQEECSTICALGGGTETCREECTWSWK